MKLSAVVITRNEEDRIERCLRSLSFCDEVLVVDSFSTDRTAVLAKSLGAKVLLKNFEDFASQKNFAAASASNLWVLSVDADEEVTEALRADIVKVLGEEEQAARHAAYSVCRQNFIFGRRMRSGESDRPVRLFRKDKARFEGVVHETLKLEGTRGDLSGELLHRSTESVKEYFNKLNLYTGLEAELLVQKGAPIAPGTFFWKPFFRFVQKYFFQYGILNGRPGFVFAGLSAYYEFVRYAKFDERKREG